ncbi:MAG: S8 family serine peptidase [Armatimonadetes bacterium]|nr:S8 family serine peptidase [Armatimonadota bacterium]
MRLRVRLPQKNMCLRFVLVIAAITCFAGASLAQARSGRLRYVPNEYIIHVQSGTSVSDVKAMVDRLGASVVAALPVSDSYWIRMGRSGEAARSKSFSGSKRLSALKWTIERIQPNYLKYLCYDPDDTYWRDGSLWGMTMIHAPAAWDREKGNPSITVAVVDSGVAPHPDLVNRLLDGKDFFEPNNVDGHYDPVGHGTHVAGTIAAQGDNKIGVVGVCMDGVKILPLRVGDETGLPSTAIISALQYILDNYAADVVNMSFGGYGYAQEEYDAIKALADAGVILVAAAGNDATNFPMYPAAWPEVISVSSVGPKEAIAPYSNYGKIEIAAPGGDMSISEEGGILSTTVVYDTATPPQPTYVYEYFQGTSMACPHVAGAAALLLSNGVLKEDVRDRLLDSARPPLYAAMDASKYGKGILDLNAAFTGGSIKILKPVKGSTALENSDFRISLKTIDTLTVKVYLDYTDNDDNGIPDNLADMTFVVLDGLNPDQDSYFSLDDKTLAFSWPLPGEALLAEGNHKVYVSGDSNIDSTSFSDWASFNISKQVIKAGVHLFAFPYSFCPAGGLTRYNWMTTQPSDLLVETGTANHVRFLTSGANRAVLMRWLPETSIMRSVPYFNYTEDKQPASKMVSEKLAWDNPRDLTWFTGGGYSNADPDTFKFPAGTGFWLYLPKDVQIDRSYAFMPADDAFNIYLYAGWNMVGNPFARKVAWGSALFSYRGDGPKSLMEAEMAGWVRSNLFEWDNVYGRYVNITARDLLEPFNGYWLRANVGSSASGDQLILTIMP